MSTHRQHVPNEQLKHQASFYDLYDESDPRNHKLDGEEEKDDKLKETIADAEVINDEITGSNSENEEEDGGN